MPVCLFEFKGRVATAALFMACASFFLTACAGGGQMETKTGDSEQIAQMEQNLTKAGFQPLYADTANKFARLRKLPQHKVVLHQVAGKYRYVYADELVCGCLYAGNKAAYQRLQAAVAQGQELQAQAAAFDTEDSEPWQGWGPWYDPAY